MVQPGPRNESVQDILNRRHVDEVETISNTPDAFDATRTGVMCRYSRFVSVRCKNLGSQSIDVQVEGSIDGTVFDVSIQPAVVVAAGNSLIAKIVNEVHKRMRVLVKNTTPGNSSSAQINVLGA
jgi:hypothetical protein